MTEPQHAIESMQQSPFSSGRVARDPITGEPKKERSEESLEDFASRHGWEIRRWENESMGYLDSYRFAKGLKTIDVSLWSKSRIICVADYKQIAISGFDNAETRKRVERVLVGMDCTCTPNEWPIPADVDEDCLIHGRASESEQVAKVRSIDLEQAQREQQAL